MSQVEQASHPCAACGGSGTSLKNPYVAPVERHMFPCPVCLGAGRIGDKMPARDAMADAETLRQTVRLYSLQTGGNPETYNLGHAEYVGDLVAQGLACGFVTATAEDTRIAARAAFRAVPSLRGDK